MNYSEKVIFCKRCVESNQRYIGTVAHKDQPQQDKKIEKKQRTDFSEDGVCSGCLYYEKKKKIDWKEREKELVDLLNKFRRKDGYFDVLVPGSGGKDSRFVSHVLKEKYNMNPLTCTWSPHMYTDIGRINFQTWLETGIDNILFTPNHEIHKKLTSLSFKNLLHPFQPFTMGQVYFPVRTAIEKKIKLIIIGDGYVEKGSGGNIYNESHTVPSALYTYKNEKDLFFGGVPFEEITQKHNISKRDLLPYMPIQEKEMEGVDLTSIGISYFINYNPQSNYYYAMQNTNFKVNPDGRTEGTYTKYQSLDDKIDGLHFYTWFIKTGRGRATDDAALEVRNNIITREEAVALVKKYDGEFPKKYFKDILNYLSMNEEEFTKIIDSFRPDHLWKKKNGKWELQQAVWK